MVPTMQNHPRKVLIVEDDQDLAESIARSVRSLDPAATIANTVAAALRLLSEAPALIICDVRLPDGSGLEVVDAALKLHPIPSIITISGSATPEEAFVLAQRGVRGYLKKPLSLPDLRQTIEQVLASPPELAPIVASLVGQRPIQEVQGEIRRIMVEQALALSAGDHADATRLLDGGNQGTPPKET
jgi:two-component system, response regulator RegA